jgi:hypothetical protein
VRSCPASASAAGSLGTITYLAFSRRPDVSLRMEAVKNQRDGALRLASQITDARFFKDGCDGVWRRPWVGCLPCRRLRGLWKRSVRVHWLAGSSAGAVTAALIAGNASDKEIEPLRAFWNFPPLENYRPEPWLHLFGWIGAIGTRLVVVAVIFTHACPRLTRSYSVACMI